MRFHQSLKNKSIFFTMAMLISLVITPWTVVAQVTGLSYSLTPAVGNTFWEDEAGLKDGVLWGGHLGLGFGQYIELSGRYLLGSDFETDFSDFPGLEASKLALLPTREVKSEQLGTALKFNFSRGRISPFVTVGAGVMRFTPDDLERSESIYWSGGAGLKFALNERLNLTLEGENFSYRYNPATALLSSDDLTGAGLQAADFERIRTHNWGLRLGIGTYLGGRPPGEMSELDRELEEQFSSGFRGLNLQLTPFYGQLEFHEALPFPESQKLVGFDADLGFGPFVGFRGFYWRGVKDGEKAAVNSDKIQMFGGEMNFKLNKGEGVIPFLTIGGGYLDVLDGYQTSSGITPKSQPFVTAGVGLDLAMIRSIRLQGSVRTILMDREEDEFVSPEEVYGSPMYSIGLSFSFGGRTDKPAIVRRETMETELERQRSRYLEEMEALRRQAAELEDALAVERSQPKIAIDSHPVIPLPLPSEKVKEYKEAPGSFLSSQTITIPVPKEGELYIRYGKPSGVSIQNFPPEGSFVFDVQQRPEQPPQKAGEFPVLERLEEKIEGLSRRLEEQARLKAVEEQEARESQAMERLEGKLEGLSRQVEEQRAREYPAAKQLETPAVRAEDQALMSKLQSIEEQLDQIGQLLGEAEAMPPIAPEEEKAPGRRPAEKEISGRRGLEGASFLIGVNLNPDPAQFLLGIRGDYGSILGGSVQVIPEFTLGFGGSTTSYQLSLNGRIPLSTHRFEPIRPYLGAGLGVLAFTEAPEDLKGIQATFNLLFGAEREYMNGKLFVEYTNMNFFEINRLHTGYRFKF
ncbi:MAG: outer membrane beta-barrel protein [bacterium]